MPQLLGEELPEPSRRSKFNFAEWADGQAWKFVRGEDYDSSTETFRYNVKRWATANGYAVEFRPYPATDRDGNELPVTKADPIALGVRFESLPGRGARVAELRSKTTDAPTTRTG